MPLKLARDSEGRPCTRCRDGRRYAEGFCPEHRQAAIDDQVCDVRVMQLEHWAVEAMRRGKIIDERHPCVRCGRWYRTTSYWYSVINVCFFCRQSRNERDEPDDAHDGGIPGPEVRDDLYERPERW